MFPDSPGPLKSSIAIVKIGIDIKKTVVSVKTDHLFVSLII
jgi:hypothetical protein